MRGKIEAKGVPGWLKILIVFCLLLAVMTAGCSETASPASTASPYSANAVLPSLSQVVDKVMPSVVFFLVETNDTNLFGEPVKAAGSGVILRSDGYILTNRHVVENFKTVEVTLHDRRVYTVSEKNIWMDDIVDLAVVKIEENNLPVVQFGDPDSINVGDWVIAVGHALGLSPLEGGATVTEGIVSNLNRSFTIDTTSYYDMIQTSAAINPGNSGGPLVNLNGDVVGIDSAGATDAQNIGFAINVGTARHVFKDLVQYGKSHHPFLGASLDDITPVTVTDSKAPKVGALITHVEPQSPAAEVGLQEGDIILNFGKIKIDTAASLIKELWRLEPGDKVDIVLWRAGSQMKLNITLGQRPQTDAL